MAIALGLNPAWKTQASAPSAFVTTAFSPLANSLIIIDSHCDGTAATMSPTIADSVGLTWTAIGTAQRGVNGGFTMSWWTYTATARTNMTATVTWGAVATKAIKATTYTGTATTGAVIAQASNNSLTNNLTVNVTTTNAGCRIRGNALDWQALGLPTSTDDATPPAGGYHVAGQISGMIVHKAADTAVAGTSVSLNFDAFGAAAPDWGYKVSEILPAAGGGPATVTLTPATITLTSVVVTPAPQPVTITLTPAARTITAVTVTAVPGAVNVTLTSAVATLNAPSVDVIIPGTPSVRNSTQSGTGAGTSLTHSVAIPTCQVGDDLWASFTLNGGHGVVTDPAGWTRVFPTTITDDGFMTLLIYRKTASGTEVAGGSITVTVGTAVRGNAGAVSIANADTSALDGSTSASGTGAATTSTSLSTTTPNTLVLSILALDSGTEIAAVPALTTERWNPTRTVTGQANAGATATKTDTTPASWNWSWSTSLAWKTWVGAVRSVSTTSSVTLTPAVMTTTAPAVTATPQPGAVTLTPVARAITAVAVTATPQPVTVTLTPVAYTITAVAVAPVPQPITVSLTPVARTITAVAVTPVPQPVNIALAPATATIVATAMSVGGVGAVTLTSATLTTSATPVVTTPGLVTTTLTPASTSTAAIPLGVTPVAVTITLTPAVMTMTALGVGLGAIGAVTLTPAQLATSARTLTATPGPISIALSTATITFAVPAVAVAPGAININITVAQATILARPVSFSSTPVSQMMLTPAQLTLTTSAGGVYVTIPGVDLMTIAFMTVTGVGEYIRGELEGTEGGVPARFALIVPGSIAWDGCDCGQFAQTITSVASSRAFPTPANDLPAQSACGHPQAIVSVTVSLLRCIPGLTTTTNNVAAPSVASLFAAARILEEDRLTLRRALNCYLQEQYKQYKIINYTIGAVQSVGPEGQCGGVEASYSFGIANDAVCCG